MVTLTPPYNSCTRNHKRYEFIRNVFHSFLSFPFLYFDLYNYMTTNLVFTPQLINCSHFESTLITISMHVCLSVSCIDLQLQLQLTN